LIEWVLDCSLALAWGFPDESSQEAERFLETLSPETVLRVPALFWYEVANALAVAGRRGRVSPAQVGQLAATFGRLPVTTAPPLAGRLLSTLVGLAREHHLSAYDAAYLELAMRSGAGLATLDRSLAAAARRVRVPVPESAE